MQSMMAMNINWAGQRFRGFDETNRLVCGHAVVSEWQMDVTDAMSTRGLDVRLRAIHRYDGFYSARLKIGKRGITFRGRAGVNLVGELIEVLYPARLEWMNASRQRRGPGPRVRDWILSLRRTNDRERGKKGCDRPFDHEFHATVAMILSEHAPFDHSKAKSFFEK